MTLSLRLRLLLLLAAALSIAFTLVHVAISAYTDVTLERVERRAVRRVLQEWQHKGATEPGVTPQDSTTDAHGCWFTSEQHSGAKQKTLEAGSNSSSLVETLKSACLFEEAPTTVKFTHTGQAYFAACAKTGDRICGLASRPLVEDAGMLGRLSLFYLSLIAASLLVTVYFALTYWVVSPLGQISRAAQRVGGDMHGLTLPNFSVSELRELAQHIVAMTQRLAAEQTQLSSKVTELTTARERLVQAQSQLIRSERLASVGQLSAGLAHEIGNPLTAIQGLLDLLIQGDLSREEELDFLRRVRRETDRIYRILQQLLQFARPTSPHLSEHGVGSLQEAVADTLPLLSPQVPFRSLSITVNIEASLPELPLPQEQLQQVLLNLLLNAASACKPGGNIQISAELQGQQVELKVQDDGSGVAPDLRERIFEPFITTKDVGEGSGLGLSVCRGLIEAAGGSIHLDPRHEAGACFVVRLPVSSLPPMSDASTV